jgi:hypothetical protein
MVGESASITTLVAMNLSLVRGHESPVTDRGGTVALA